MTQTPSSENTAVVATYPARHYAEIAKDFLIDQGIDSFVTGDDVHVPLQLTEGVRVFVMESRATEAYEALEGAGLLPDSIMEDPQSDDEAETE